MARGIFFDGSQDHLDCGQERAAYGLNAMEEAGDGVETDRLKPGLRFGGLWRMADALPR